MLMATNASVGCPQMLEEQSNLVIRQLKDFRWNLLIRRTLIKNTQLFEPKANPGRVPAITVARDHQLMPITFANMAINRAAKRFCCLGDDS